MQHEWGAIAILASALPFGWPQPNDKNSRQLNLLSLFRESGAHFCGKGFKTFSPVSSRGDSELA
jgi:hypothetical protein